MNTICKSILLSSLVAVAGCAENVDDDDEAIGTAESDLTEPRNYGVSYDVAIVPSNPPTVCEKSSSTGRRACRQLLTSTSGSTFSFATSVTAYPQSVARNEGSWSGKVYWNGKLYEGCTYGMKAGAQGPPAQQSLRCKFKAANWFWTKKDSGAYYASATLKVVNSVSTAASCYTLIFTQDPAEAPTCLTPP